MQIDNQLVTLKEQPLCGLASAGSSVCVIYPKLIMSRVYFELTHQKMVNIFLLSLSPLLVQQAVTKRPSVMTFNGEDIKFIKAQSQKCVIVALQDHFYLVQVMYDMPVVNDVKFDLPINIKNICYQAQNQDKIINLIYILEPSNRVSKYSIHEIGTVLESTLSPSQHNIIYMDTVKYTISSILSEFCPLFLLIIDQSLDVALYNAFDSKFIPKLKFNLKQLTKTPIQKTSPTNIHYNSQLRALHIQIGTNIYVIRFKHKLSILSTPTVPEYINSFQVHQNIQGELICSNKDGLIIKNDKIVYQIRNEKSEQASQNQIRNQIINQKKQITAEILKQSQKAKNNLGMQWMAVDSDEQVIDDQKNNETDPLLNYLDQTKEIQNIIKQHEQSGKQQEPTPANIGQAQQNNIEPLREKEISKQIQVQVAPHAASEEQAIANEEKTQINNSEQLEKQPPSFKSQVPQQYKSCQNNNNSHFPDKQISSGVQISTQTQEQYPSYDLTGIEQQVQQRLSKFTQILQQQISFFYDKAEQQLQTFRKTMRNIIQESIRDHISNQIKQYMGEMFAPKIQKYLSITFNKLNEMVEAGNNHQSQYLTKEQIKYSEINKHIIQRNKEFTQKTLEVVKTCITKFDHKKQQMTVDFQAKFNLLNDLVLQAQELTKKFQIRIKQENEQLFQKKALQLIQNIQEGLKQFKKSQQQIYPPPILQTNLSHASQQSQINSSSIVHPVQHPAYQHPNLPSPQFVPQPVNIYQPTPTPPMNYSYPPNTQYQWAPQFPQYVQPPIQLPNYPPPNSFANSYNPQVPNNDNYMSGNLGFNQYQFHGGSPFQQQPPNHPEIVNQSNFLKSSHENMNKSKFNN